MGSVGLLFAGRALTRCADTSTVHMTHTGGGGPRQHALICARVTILCRALAGSPALPFPPRCRTRGALGHAQRALVCSCRTQRCVSQTVFVSEISVAQVERDIPFFPNHSASAGVGQLVHPPPLARLCSSALPLFFFSSPPPTPHCGPTVAFATASAAPAVRVGVCTSAPWSGLLPRLRGDPGVPRTEGRGPTVSLAVAFLPKAIPHSVQRRWQKQVRSEG